MGCEFQPLAVQANKDVGKEIDRPCFEMRKHINSATDNPASSHAKLLASA